MSTHWYVARNQQKLGPYSSEQLKQLATDGQVSPADQVWKEGMAVWAPAGKINGLFPATARSAEPPPIPPPTLATSPEPPVETPSHSIQSAPNPLPKASLIERAKAGAADLAATAKAAAQLTARQAERTKINQVTLPQAYAELGRQVHAAGNFRQELDPLFQKLDKTLSEIRNLQAGGQVAPTNQGLADKAKAAALAAKDAAHAKGLQLMMVTDFRELGKAVYEKYGEQSGAPETIRPVQDALARIATLDSEIAKLSETKSGKWITPKRFAIAAAIILVVGVISASSNSGKRSSGGSGANYELGKEFQLGDYKYVIQDAHSRPYIGSQFVNATASQGATFVVVGYSIENCSKKSQRVMSDDFKLLDSEGREFEPSSDAGTALLAESRNKDFIISELQPGVPRQMTQAFELPSKSLSSELTLVIPEKGLFGSDEVNIKLKLK